MLLAMAPHPSAYALIVFVALVLSGPACSQAGPEAKYPRVTWQGKVFEAGKQVRLVSRAGTFKPPDTGHEREIWAGPGHTGRVVDGEVRVPTAYFTPAPGEPIQILRIRWDPQTWQDDHGGEVKLPAFEATVHVSYLEPTGD